MRSVAIAAVVVLAGCPDREVSEVEPDQVRVETKDMPLEINNDVDILFVIDNSISMEEEQTSLQANFDRFIDVLDNIEGGLPDVHIGVVSSDVGALGVLNDLNCHDDGDDGVLHVGTAALGGDSYISDVADPNTGARITNYNQGTTTLTDQFRAIATLGTSGCGFEQHLQSMRRALENPTNGDFIRPGAHLAVVIIADEDDCSAADPTLFGNAAGLGPLASFRCFDYGVTCDEPDNRAAGLHTNCRPREPANYLVDPSVYVDFLAGYKATDLEHVIVATIVGERTPVEVQLDPDPELLPSCTYPNPDPTQEDQAAFPSIRLGAFVDGFGGDGRAATICTDDLSGPLTEVGQLIANSFRDACIKYGLADTDPSTPEIDYQCAVSLRSSPDTADGFDTPIPECDATASVQPCWRLVADPQCSSFPTGLAFQIVGSEALPDSTYAHADCVVE
jgi:hypothetical protein